MNVKSIIRSKFHIVAVMDGDECPAEIFLFSDDVATVALRENLFGMLRHLASSGFANCPSAWTHEASKQEKIFEFIKGDIRLFYFKGAGNQIAVCTTAKMKNSKKADKPSVERASKWRKQYEKAYKDETLTVIEEMNDEAE